MHNPGWTRRVKFKHHTPSCSGHYNSSALKPCTLYSLLMACYAFPIGSIGSNGTGKCSPSSKHFGSLNGNVNIVLPELKPNVIVGHTFDSGLLASGLRQFNKATSMKSLIVRKTTHVDFIGISTACDWDLFYTIPEYRPHLRSRLRFVYELLLLEYHQCCKTGAPPMFEMSE